jgi:PH (Pleckstrin Homology) domain-containing protein
VSYVSKTLISGETIIHEATISLWTQTPLILLGLILLPVFGIGLVFWIIAYYKSTELAVTSKRTVAKFGFISRHTMEMNLSKIETIQVKQSLLGRMFDYGSLIISGAGIPQEPIPGIGQPMEFRRAVMEAQENAISRRSEYGARIPAIPAAGYLEAPASNGPILTYRQRIIVRIVGITLMFCFLAWIVGALPSLTRLFR